MSVDRVKEGSVVVVTDAVAEVVKVELKASTKRRGTALQHKKRRPAFVIVIVIVIVVA